MTRKPFSKDLIDLMLVEPNMLGDINTHALRSIVLLNYQLLEKHVFSLRKDLEDYLNISAPTSKNNKGKTWIPEDQIPSNLDKIDMILKRKFNGKIRKLHSLDKKCRKYRNTLVHGTPLFESTTWQAKTDSEGNSPAMPLFSSNLKLLNEKTGDVVSLEISSLRDIYKDMDEMKRLLLDLIEDIDYGFLRITVEAEKVTTEEDPTFHQVHEVKKYTMKEWRERKRSHISLLHCGICGGARHSDDLCPHLQQLWTLHG